MSTTITINGKETEVYNSVTVDSSHSIDLDDAFWVKQCDDGSFNLKVFISNTAEIVTVGCKRYIDAQDKVASQYHSKGIRESMLSLTATHHLSLNYGDESDVVVFDIHIPLSGAASLSSVSKGVAKNICRFDFELKQKSPAIPEIEDMMIAAHKCAHVLFKERLSSGAIAFADIENGFITNEEGVLIDVAVSDVHAQIMIQEFMIVTNGLFAEYAKENDLPIIYRNHSAPKAIGQRTDFVNHMFDVYASGNLALINLKAMPRAFYNTFSRCHFGLALPSYSTITSPIRRFPDLHNMSVLDNFLDGVESSVIDESVCDAINEVILSRKDSTANFLMSRDEKTSLSKFKSGDQQMTATELKFTIKNKPVGDDANKLALLVMTGIQRTRSTELIRAAWTYGIEADKAHRVMLCSGQFAIKGLLGSAVREMISQSKASIEFNRDGAELKMGGLSVSTTERNDKKALMLLAKAWVIKFYDVSESAVKAESGNKKVDHSIKNWKGDLFEHCRSHGITAPEFNAKQQGEVHAPTFTCSISVSKGGDVFTSTGTGGKSKSAEQSAAQRMLVDHLLGGKKQKPSSAVSAKVETIKAAAGESLEIKPVVTKKMYIRNWKGDLLALCDRHAISPPSFFVKTSGPTHSPMFTCTLTLNADGQEFVAGGSGEKSNTAERMASMAMLEQLSELDKRLNKSKLTCGLNVKVVGVGATKAGSDAIGASVGSNGIKDFKSALMIFSQKNKIAPPAFTSEAVPTGKTPSFSATCILSYKDVSFEGKGFGPSKKRAEQSAASIVLGNIMQW